MSLIVKDNDQPLPPSVAKGPHPEIYERRHQLAQLVKRYDKEAVWDAVQARDLNPELVEYVCDRLNKGSPPDVIRRQLGILRATDKSWRKIMSAIKQGFRIDGTAHLMLISQEYRSMSEKLKDQIMSAFEHGIEVPTKEGTVTVKGPSKELSMTIDAYNRLNQGFIKNAKDLGAYVEQDQKSGGNSGVTIVVQTNVPLPSAKDVQAHQENEKKKNEIILAQGRTLENEPSQKPKA